MEIQGEEQVGVQEESGEIQEEVFFRPLRERVHFQFSPPQSPTHSLPKDEARKPPARRQRRAKVDMAVYKNL